MLNNLKPTPLNIKKAVPFLAWYRAPQSLRTHLKTILSEKITLLVPVQVNICKWLAIIDGKYTEEAFACPHVLVSHGTVLLLSSCIQYVQQAGLTVYNHLFSVRILGAGCGEGEGESPLLLTTTGNAMLLPRLSKLLLQSISVSLVCPSNC